ncbi:MAG: hypothetical protein JJ938_10090 [Roseicyclus sp.]|nr:hypothetical protein [Roseicyclus sp.]MBO6625220.1 hypothetical protein [Roseicyclus sp.]
MPFHRHLMLAALLALTGMPGAAEEAMTWRYDRLVDPNPADTHLTLTFGGPHADAAVFLATCAIGVEESFAEIRIRVETAGYETGTPVAYTLDIAPGFTMPGQGLVTGGGSGAGIGGVAFSVGMTAPLWEALRDGREMQFALSADMAEILPLGGIGAMATAFREDCAGIRTLGAAGPVWERLDDSGITALLTAHDLVYENGDFQRFLPSGRTLYRAAETSWGYWRAEGGRYCSQWPPGDAWDCYDLHHDGGNAVRFTDDWGNVSTGVFAE